LNAYERLLEVMRKQGKKDNPSSLQLGNYEAGKVKLDNQTLDSNDYLIAEGLVMNEGDILLIYQIDDTQFVIICKVVNGNVSV